MDKKIKELEKLFNGDISDWMMLELPKYLNENFDEWVINPITKNSVEIFISGFDEQELWEIEEDLFDESIYVALNLLEVYGICPNESMEILPDFAVENIYIHPLSGLGDEPVEEDDKLLTSKDFNPSI